MLSVNVYIYNYRNDLFLPLYHNIICDSILSFVLIAYQTAWVEIECESDGYANECF